MSLPKIYQSPDGNDLAIENSDGEFTELHRLPWNAWQAQGLLEVVPDTWVRLVPSARASSVEADGEHGMWYVNVLDDEPVHHTTEGAPVTLDWTRDGNLIGIELLGPGGEVPGSNPPMGRVFLAGETVPAGIPVVNHVGDLWRHHEDRAVKTGWAIEVVLPSVEALEEHVQRRRWVDQMMQPLAVDHIDEPPPQ